MLLSRNSNVYSNDQDGNTLSGGGRTNGWDSQNRLVSCVDGSNASTHVYGADGYRHQSTVNGVTTDFVLDSSMVVRDRRAGINYATYLIGANGPVYRRDDTSGSARWYLFDGLGSVLGEIDPEGNVTDFNRYDVYGSLRGRTGTATTAHGFVGQLGHTSEAETGLIYMRARYMDPVVGRFVSEDPKYAGINWYGYARCNPTLLRDFTGRETLGEEEEADTDAASAEGNAGDGSLDVEKWLTQKLERVYERYVRDAYEDEFGSGRDFQNWFHRVVKRGFKVARGADNTWFDVRNGDMYLLGADGTYELMGNLADFLD